MNQMVRKRLCAFIVLIKLLFVIGGNAYAKSDDWPDIDAPPGSNVQWVAQNIVQNGVPMRIQTFSSEYNVEDVLSHYRASWDDGTKLKPVVNNLGEWQIIGKQVGDYYLTVQVKNGLNSVSEGFMAVSKLPAFDGDSNFNESFPRLGNTKTVSDTKSNDDGKLAETIIFENDYSIQSNVSFYESVLPNKGWKKRQSRAPIRSTRPGHAMYFERSGESCQIVINQDRNGKSIVLVNLSTTKL